VYFTHLGGSGAANVWAVGASPTGKSVARYDGRSWSVVPLPKGQNWSLYGLAVAGPADVWVAGETYSSGAPVVAHWNGQSWRTFALRAPAGCDTNSTGGVALTPSAVLVVGYTFCSGRATPMWWAGPR
jgi:hypothetical protein